MRRQAAARDVPALCAIDASAPADEAARWHVPHLPLGAKCRLLGWHVRRVLVYSSRPVHATRPVPATASIGCPRWYNGTCTGSEIRAAYGIAQWGDHGWSGRICGPVSIQLGGLVVRTEFAGVYREDNYFSLAEQNVCSKPIWTRDTRRHPWSFIFSSGNPCTTRRQHID